MSYGESVSERAVLSYGDSVSERPDTKELQETQSRREAGEEALAGLAPEEAATHQRRAEKAHYLRQKLEQRAESEKETTSSPAEEASGPEVSE